MAIKKDEIERIMVHGDMIDYFMAVKRVEMKIDERLLNNGGRGGVFSKEDFCFDDGVIFYTICKDYRESGWDVEYDDCQDRIIVS